MKLRFSIRTLLGITAYLALNTAAWVRPLGFLPYAVLSCDVVVLLAIIAVAVGQPRADVVFARGVLLGIVLVYLLQVAVPDFQWDANPARVYGRLPGSTVRYMDRLRIDQVHSNLINKSIVATGGLLGGCLAVWRYRVLERRPKEPPK